MKAILAIAVGLALTLPALAADRSQKTRRAFMLESPCPSTGETKGKCPGYVADHIIPLCAGGRDEPWNLQWQTVEASREKDRIEVRECAAARARTGSRPAP